ncbi:MAG: substrate-binding domain-containing protein [Plesiomonas shigelloides]|uniref:substrate-binding domain-containing protein n=1 Tax=Plesiomonas shigelloides TaxID=703 RepID=UPI0012628A5A|nr:substrate-binding domain-containing protein [Plesiomonas shigelloides]KAB7690450.1 LacI family DNA-binding transcriptional regulator [Plesiomonas shigelloides]
MATMKDVARLAGVSTSTVSHVINNSRFVSDEIRARIMAAVETLNYSPSALARSLKVNQTRTIGMLVTTSNNPFFAEVVRGVEQTCYERGYNLVLCNTAGDPKRMSHSLDMLLQKRVDGLLMMCSESRVDVSDVFRRHPAIPMVVMDWGPLGIAADLIQDNSEYGGYLATRYLLAQGHRRIGIITGPLDKQPSQGRLQGYRRALQEAGVTELAQYLAEGDFDFDGGIKGMRQLLACEPRPTAVFAGNDVMAVGAYQVLHQAGLRIPQDMSVLGYDDIELARYLAPALSTIHQPKEDLGQLAVDTLLARIDDRSKPADILLLEPSLVIRESVAALSE